MIQVIIPGRFPSLNEFIGANRQRHGIVANNMKKRDQRKIVEHLPRGIRFKKKVFIEYHFYEPNTKRDKDNINSYFHKIFQDALVQAGMLKDDKWEDIDGMSDFFYVDKKWPRVEVYIEEAK